MKPMERLWKPMKTIQRADCGKPMKNNPLTIYSNRRKFRSQTSDIFRQYGQMEKQRCEESRRRRKEVRRWERRKKMQVREKVGKLGFTVSFQWFVAQEGWKVGSLKRRVRSHVVRWEMKSCTPLWREAHSQVKSAKKLTVSDHFWKVAMSKKVHAVVARSTFPSQNAQSTPCPEHFLEAQMSKKCTLLWREARFQVKSEKTDGLGPLLEVAMSKKCTPCQSQNVQSTPCSEHFWKRTTLHCTYNYNHNYNATLHYTTLHYSYTTLLNITLDHYTSTIQLQK